MKIVLYHNHCPDGFAAALAARTIFGDSAVYLGANYGDTPPDVADKEVYVIDFSYSLEVMQSLAERASRIVWLDHHASSELIRDGLMASLEREGLSHKVHTVIDMEHSGAVLAWQHFHPERPIPRLFQHIQDRDLWNWKLSQTEGFSSALDDLPLDFEVWGNLLTDLENDGIYAEFVNAGEIGFRKFLRLCERIANRAEPVIVNGVVGLQVNASEDFSSRVGELLSSRTGTYGLIWNIRGGVVYLSFRGAPGFDVLPLAEKFGGGGHKTAAGARITLSNLSELLGSVSKA